jgi:hypothetical protein
MQGRLSDLASVPLVDVVSHTVMVVRYARAFVWSRLCSFGLRGLSQSGGEPIVKRVGLVSPPFLWSAWVQ